MTQFQDLFHWAWRIHWVSPGWLWLGFGLCLLWLLRSLSQSPSPHRGLSYPALELLLGTGTTKHIKTWERLLSIPQILRVLSLLALCAALARPQLPLAHQKNRHLGLDILMAVDTSGSMRALDFQWGEDQQPKDRLWVVKQVMKEFIQKRSEDRLGLVVFGTHVYGQTPLTLDHDVLLEHLDNTEIGMAGEATAIGDAIAFAVNRFKEIASRSRVLILLTDGANTEGRVDPREAAQAAKAFDVKIYTVGCGRQGPVPMPTPMGIRSVQSDLDEKLLQEVANQTGGRYFHAEDTQGLTEVYRIIDKLEKTEKEASRWIPYEDFFPWMLMLAGVCLFLELVLQSLGLVKVLR